MKLAVAVNIPYIISRSDYKQFRLSLTAYNYLTRLEKPDDGEIL